MNEWMLLILTLPTENTAIRMRVWRAIKAAGAAVLRDGVYLLPASDEHAVVFGELADTVNAAQGTAYRFRVDDAEAPLTGLFDRTDEYGRFIESLDEARRMLDPVQPADAARLARKLRKQFDAIADIDFFSGEARRQAEAALAEFDAAVTALSPGEPSAQAGAIPRLDLATYQGRTWATRRRPWVDRLASAWLIARFIDQDARFLWLAAPEDCPADALGFDFDGATFSHVDHRVTFETLLASFGLEQPALARIGAVVHFLDVGGVPPAEAAGVSQVLAGLRTAIEDDDQLLTAARAVFDGLFAAFSQA